MADYDAEFALATHLNAALWGCSPSPARLVRQGDREVFTLPGKGGLKVLGAPGEWLAAMACSGLRTAWYGPSFTDAGARWGVVAAGNGVTYQWRLSRRKESDGADTWTEAWYICERLPDNAGLRVDDPCPAAAALERALQHNLAFQKEHRPGDAWAGERMQTALNFLEDMKLREVRHPIPAHVAALFPDGVYSVAAHQLMAAADVAYLGRGLGSWEDWCPRQSERALYFENVVRQYYSALSGALIGASRMISSS